MHFLHYLRTGIKVKVLVSVPVSKNFEWYQALGSNGAPSTASQYTQPGSAVLYFPVLSCPAVCQDFFSVSLFFVNLPGHQPLTIASRELWTSKPERHSSVWWPSLVGWWTPIAFFHEEDFKHGPKSSMSPTFHREEERGLKGLYQNLCSD